MTRSSILPAAAGLAAVLLGGAALAAPPAEVSLTLKGHRFTPSQFTVPAGQRVQIHLTNLDGATEEFDSHDLRVEKLVTPGGKVSFWIGPLKPGAYAFMGEFHAATAKGRVVAVKP